jgi:hypothetical protein
MRVDRLGLAAAGLALISLVVFAVLFDPNMRGNERALLDVAVAAALAGAGLTFVVRRGITRRSGAILAAVLLLGAVVFAVISFEDLRVDRGNKKAFIALGVAAASAASAITSIIARRPVGVPTEGSIPPAA